ncbi:hypothetical protein AQUSIP_16980 [Aquicella siphonis]|uniref:Uncharacterized protein n=1 Tax=Aquicella siphonis TaxID=254247 RepID=A0A5E4PJB0_9COXI|nr:hypothetical protein [Aquicella siphonis]VVC76386.1 hypothetical protein AQUSIP_16980 [Aquicella siphonis]
MKTIITLLVTFASAMNAYAGQAVSPGTAPDSTTQGPHTVATAEYRLPAAIDKDILSDRMTEIWAKAYYPADLMNSDGKMPLVVMLHGNHATCGIGSMPRRDTNCEYTYSGSCPAGYVPVPNHEGYDYLAKNLASWGMGVISINANRGITCGGGNDGDWGLNLARGKLVLKHLSLLYQWSTSGGAPASLGLGDKGLLGKVDFSHVGLLGHSRGGEGVRAAYNLYKDAGSPWPARIPGLEIKAIFEIGAVDGQTSRVLDADGTVWNQLLPMCDGDVSDLEGRYPYERMLMNTRESSKAQKSLYEVWGANHNFFNTEWQGSDSYGCSAGKPIFDQKGYYSTEQQQVALASVPAFFRSRLGLKAEPVFNQNFNPLNELPGVVKKVTQVDREFTPSPGASENAVVDDFDKPTGINSSGNANIARQIQIEHKNLESNRDQRVAAISWTSAGPETYFESVWAAPSQGKDIHDYATLDFRTARISKSGTGESGTDFGVVLTDASGLVSKEIPVSQFALINGPGNYNPVLQTVRIPLSVFQGVDLTRIHSVRFVFDKSATGKLYFANIRAQKQMGLGYGQGGISLAAAMHKSYAMPASTLVKEEYVPENLNTIRSIRMVHKSFALSGQPAVEITLASEVPFQAMNSLPVLKIGNKQYKLSRYTDLKTLKELTFTLSDKEYKEISREGAVTVTNGKIWKFGSIAKSLK